MTNHYREAAVMRKQVTISLAPELLKEVDRFAKVEKRDRSEVIRDAVRNWIMERKLTLLQKKAAPYFRRAGIYSDEDVFRLFS